MNIIDPSSCELTLNNAAIYRRWKDNLIKILWEQEISDNWETIQKWQSDRYLEGESTWQKNKKR